MSLERNTVANVGSLISLWEQISVQNRTAADVGALIPDRDVVPLHSSTGESQGAMEVAPPGAEGAACGSSRSRTLGGKSSGRVVKRLRAAAARLRTLTGSWDAAVAAVTRLPLSHGGIRRDVRSWHANVREKLIRIAVTQGIEASVAELKKFSSDARRAWIEHSSPTHFLWRSAPPSLRSSQTCWAQMSFIGRSLPTGSPRHVENSLANHQRDLTSKFKTSAAHLSSLTEWVTAWAKRYLPSKPSKASVMAMTSGSSATYSKTREAGGLTADLAELLGSAAPMDLERPEEVTHSAWSSIVSELRLIEAAKQELPQRTPKGRVVTVAERGHKVRVVTAMERSVLVLGHCARRRLMLGLRKWPLLRSVLLGEPREVVRELEGSTGLVLSSDLRAASNLVPFDVADAIVEGLALSGRVLEEELLGLRACTGPQELAWPNGEVRKTSRGILMGLPTTWALLNLYHGWCWNAAERSDSLPVGPTALRSPIKSVARVCGDDLIGVSTPAGIRAYESRLRETGAEFSAGKHFLSPDRGVFLEVLWEFRGSRFTVLDGDIGYWRTLARKERRGRRIRILTNQVRLHTWSTAFALPAMPLRGLVAGDVPGRDAYAPDWWTAGVAETAYASQYPLKTVTAVARTLRPDLPGRFEAVGIPPFLPRELGGAGLATHSAKLQASKTHRRALASFLYGVGSHSGPSSFERVWTDSRPSPWRSLAAEGVDGWFAQAQIVPSSTPIRVGWVDLGDPEEIRESLIQRQEREYEFMLGPDPESVKYPSLFTLAKRLGKVRSRLLDKWREEDFEEFDFRQKTLSEVKLRWRELRGPLSLRVPEFVPDDLEDPHSPKRYNAYLMEKPGSSFLSTWRRLAISAVAVPSSLPG